MLALLLIVSTFQALNPKDALALQYRGAAYAEKKDMRRANLDAAAALTINPSPDTRLRGQRPVP